MLWEWSGRMGEPCGFARRSHCYGTAVTVELLHASQILNAMAVETFVREFASAPCDVVVLEVQEMRVRQPKFDERGHEAIPTPVRWAGYRLTVEAEAHGFDATLQCALGEGLAGRLGLVAWRTHLAIMRTD